MKLFSWKIAPLVALASTGVGHAEDAEIAKVKAADQAFYVALSARDLKAMEAVWAQKPYVTNIGPRSKTVSVGYEDAVSTYWAKAFDTFSQMSAQATAISQIQIDGNVAWVIGTESAVLQLKSGGAPMKFDAMVTNIFEKDGDHWLMVSHHAQMVPQ
jgi:ketosteroid isomerase-like protein